MAILAQNNYPSLNTIANLVRSLINDDKLGATGTPGEGQILTNTSITLQNFMNSAIRDLYRELRIMGSPTLVKDQYILTGLPPVNSSLGSGVANPAVQVSLLYTGFFDGLKMWSNYTLPSDMILPLQLWERESGTNYDFRPIPQSEGPLSSYNQGLSLGQWEWRTDQIWMNGSINPRDVRIRYISTYIDLVAPSINWNYTYVPVMDSQEAIADKVAVRYAQRMGGETLAAAMAQAKESSFKLRQEFTRSRQKIDYHRPIYGGNAGNAGDPSTFLY